GPSGAPSEAGRSDDGLVFEAPVMRGVAPGSRPFPRVEVAWVIFELDPDYIRANILPELVQTHLGSGGSLEYQVEVVSRNPPRLVLWRSDPNRTESIAATADASIPVLEPRFDPGFLMAMQGGRGPGRGRGGQSFGRWEMYVRHRSGSLEAVV